MNSTDPDHPTRSLCCWRCDRPARFRVDDPSRGMLGYCSEHFNRLTHVLPGSAVSLVVPRRHEQFQSGYVERHPAAS